MFTSERMVKLASPIARQASSNVTTIFVFRRLGTVMVRMTVVTIAMKQIALYVNASQVNRPVFIGMSLG